MGVVLTTSAGLVLLVVAAEALVRGASRLAVSAGLSRLVVGLTIVAFGTSAPELAVSVRAAAGGETGLALGNVLGSNACNVLLILGLSALIAPLTVEARLVRIDVPVMIGISALAYGLALDGNLGRFDGLLLLGCGLAHSVWTVVEGRRAGAGPGNDDRGDAPVSPRAIAVAGALALGGLVGLALGARWLVDGATALARWAGLTELVIGLTVVAVGTSLPELATSIIASVRGERDLAVGNVVGSNIFNVLLVLGLVAALAGVPVSRPVLVVDFPIVLAVSVACLPVFFTGHVIARWEGGLFVACHAAYLAYTVLRAKQWPGLDRYELAMLGLVLPLAGVTLAVTAWREHRSRRPRG